MAWRVLYATMLARTVPEMPWSVLLEIEEWPALSCAIHHYPFKPRPLGRGTLCWGSKGA